MGNAPGSRLVAAVLVGALALSAGCGPGVPNDVTLVRQSVNPSGAREAFLIRRHNGSALNNDLYMIQVVPAHGPFASPAMSRMDRDSAALIATRADSLRLKWNSDTELLVVCDRCGMESVDIMQSRASAAGVRIKFLGLPSSDAYGHPAPPRE